MRSRQLDYYYKVGRARRKAKSKARKAGKPPTNPPIPSQSKLSTLKLRLHRLQRTHTILNALSEEKLRSLKLNRLNNTNQYLGAGFRITTQHLELEGIEMISDFRVPPAVLEGLAISAADNIAQSLARQYGLVINKEGTTPPKLTEFELNASQMTERMEHRGLIELYSDNEGYKVWVDWSFGIGGLESNKTFYIQKLTTFANDLMEKDAWELMKARQKQHEREISDVRQGLWQLTEQMNIHAPYLTAWKIVADAIKDPTKRERARKVIESLGQRQLL